VLAAHGDGAAIKNQRQKGRSASGCTVGAGHTAARFVPFPRSASHERARGRRVFVHRTQATRSRIERRLEIFVQREPSFVGEAVASYCVAV
jgi:hypothetical protein